MSAVYSTQFAAVRAPGGAGSGLYTVPAGMVAVIRSISVTPISGSLSAGKYIFVRTATNDAVLWGPPAVSAGVSGIWSGRQVLNEGDQLRYVDPGTQTDYLVSGYLLSAP